MSRIKDPNALRNLAIRITSSLKDDLAPRPGSKDSEVKERSLTDSVELGLRRELEFDLMKEDIFDRKGYRWLRFLLVTVFLGSILFFDYLVIGFVEKIALIELQLVEKNLLDAESRIIGWKVVSSLIASTIGQLLAVGYMLFSFVFQKKIPSISSLLNSEGTITHEE